MKYSKELHDTLVKSNYYDSHIINALLDEIDRLNAERRWIPVSERLPEENEMVFGITYEGVRAVMWHDVTWTTWDDRVDDDPTHWMPLPEPPESEG